MLTVPTPGDAELEFPFGLPHQRDQLGHRMRRSDGCATSTAEADATEADRRKVLARS